MALTAFTNQVGSFYRYTDRTNATHTYWLNGSWYDTTSHETKGIMDAWSYKSPTVHSDHIAPTNYGRAITNITEDRPAFLRDRTFRDDGKPSTDETHMRYLSPGYPTMFMSAPKAFDVLMENARKRSVTEARNDLHKVKMQLGADLAEAVKTVNMVANSAKDMWSMLLKLKRLDFFHIPPNQWRNLLNGRSISNRYLEYTYGWKPLVNTIYDGIEMFDYLKDKPGFYIHGKKSSRVSHIETRNGTPNDETWVCTGDVKVNLLATVSSQATSDVDALGLLNPLSIAWELVPFSFVLDWGIPVGSFLESVSATAGLKFLRGWQSTRQGWVFRADTATDKLPTFQTALQRGRLKIEHFGFRRDALNSFPLPELYGKENPFSTSHVTSALALFRQLMKT